MLGIFLNNLTEWEELAIGGGVLALLIGLGALMFLIILAVYIYFALAWMTIAKKLNYKYPWLAWIPVASWIMLLQLGNFHWAWIFLILLPVVGWIALFVLIVISTWRIYEKLNYPGWLSLARVLGFIPKVSGIGTIAHAVIIGFVAWGKENQITKIKKVTARKVSKKRKR